MGQLDDQEEKEVKLKLRKIKMERKKGQWYDQKEKGCKIKMERN